jgi:hypothetical protein
MRKLCLIIGCAVLVSAFLVSCREAFAAEAIFVQGKVQMMGSQETEWKDVQVGTTLDIGDTVRTARKSKLDVALDAAKKNVIQLGEKTLAVLNSESMEEVDRLNLSRGRVYANLEGIKEGLSFEVTTPSSVAGVRGSSYMVYSEVDSDEISAYKDTVFLKTFDSDKNMMGEMMVPQGFKTFVERFEAPGALMQISLREFDRFDTIKEDLTSRAEGREPYRAEEERRKLGVEEKFEQVLEQGGLTEEVTASQEIVDEANTEQQIIDQRTIDSGHEEEYTPPTGH